MTITLNGRADFTLENYRRVTLDGEGLVIGQAARAAMAAARRSFVELLESDRTAFIYGTTTGGGPLASLRIPPEEQLESARSRRLRPSSGDSFGLSELPERVVRGIVFARLSDFVEGHAKCRPQVADLLTSMLDGPMPPVPLGGETSSGEIVALAHVMSALPDFEFEEGEYGSLINGSPCSAALAADVALEAPNRMALADAVFALSVEAMNAPLSAYHPALRAMWGDPFVAEVLDALNGWLDGAGGDRRPYQAPVSYRILPRVLGQAHRAVAQIADVARISLASVKENPVYVPPDDQHPLGFVLHTGGYHNAIAYPAMDTLTAAWADLCTLADRHTTKLHRSDASQLPEMLARPGEDPWASTGLLGFVQVGFGERARHAAARTFLPPSEGGVYGGQDDVALPTFLAYEKNVTASTQLDCALAILSVVASQALEITNRRPAVALEPLLEIVRSHVPVTSPATSARPRGDEIGRLAETFSAAALSGDVPRPRASRRSYTAQ